jgi:hypothetical protein
MEQIHAANKIDKRQTTDAQCNNHEKGDTLATETLTRTEKEKGKRKER